MTHLLALFPFEPALYAKDGLPVTYVGHPLADVIPMEPDKAKARTELRVPAGSRVVALLPGSRRSELHYMADLFVQTARRLLQDLPNALFRLSHRLARDARHVRGRVAPARGEGSSADAAVRAFARGAGRGRHRAGGERHGDAGDRAVQDADGDRVQAVAVHLGADAPDGLPAVHRPAEHPRGRALVPEFVQDKATPGKLANALLDLLHDAGAQRRQIEKFREIHAILRQNTAQKAADAVLAVLDAGRS